LYLPAPAAQVIFRKQVAGIRRMGCRVPNCTEPPRGWPCSLDAKSLAPGNVTQEMSFAPKQLIKQGVKLVPSP